MNKVIGNLFLILVLSSIVLAGSTTSVGFTILDGNGSNIEESIEPQSLFYSYGLYFVGVLVILIIGFVLLTHKKGKKSKKKAYSKKKIVSKKK